MTGFSKINHVATTDECSKGCLLEIGKHLETNGAFNHTLKFGILERFPDLAKDWDRQRRLQNLR